MNEQLERFERASLNSTIQSTSGKKTRNELYLVKLRNELNSQSASRRLNCVIEEIQRTRALKPNKKTNAACKWPVFWLGPLIFAHLKSEKIYSNSICLGSLIYIWRRDEGGSSHSLSLSAWLIGSTPRSDCERKKERKKERKLIRMRSPFCLESKCLWQVQIKYHLPPARALD